MKCMQLRCRVRLLLRQHISRSRPSRPAQAQAHAAGARAGVAHKWTQPTPSCQKCCTVPCEPLKGWQTIADEG